MRYANGSAGECRQEKARDHVPMTGEVQGLLQRFVESHREGVLGGFVVFERVCDSVRLHMELFLAELGRYR